MADSSQTLEKPIEIGAAAPDFTLEATTGSVHLADFRNKENVVLFFIREYSCPQCQRHASNLSKIADELKALDTEVLIIGSGTPADAANYARKLRLRIPVLADAQRSVYHQYGLRKGMLAVLYVQRSATVLIDKTGIVRYIEHSTNPNASFNPGELLAEIRKVQK
ncbi:peroxiredoxin [Ktedonobacter sp. SOSP1-85]|uniref:peroxiredoxin family protein n=1 Tax=Ktedonobacter sp. SOSP1-85 TaxID=2778367 RepID=UPI0019165804|nr:redoxin domain-containing protein [Ktedonobacter sp. SOSP1-85]GHO80631.1 peroxiredoxin [Ktedonobacter sp. SOSP1-85]